MPESRQRSVRRQLLVLLLTAVSVAWIIAATVSFRDARHEVAEVLDAHLAQTASLISVQREREEDDDEVDTEHAPVLHRYGRRVMFQVWKNGTTLGLHSQHAPDSPLSIVKDGFSDATIGGARWRVFSTWDPRNRVLVQVAEQDYERDELATAVARNFVVPLAITLPIVGLMVWAAVGRATRSLTHVNQQVAVESRGQSDAARRGRCAVRNRSPGDEPQSAVRARSRTDRTGAPVHRRCCTRAQDPARRDPRAGTGGAGRNERCRARARAGRCDDWVRSRHPRGRADVDLRSTRARRGVVSADVSPARRCAENDDRRSGAGRARRSRWTSSSQESEPAVVLGDAGLLGILFRNVIDNAIRYSPAGTKVGIDLDVAGTEAQIRVRDAGPGISAEERANVGRRFYRAPGTKAAGSGLGLSIVQRIADLHRGSIRLETSPAGAGLQVVVVLPRARETS